MYLCTFTTSTPSLRKEESKQLDSSSHFHQYSLGSAILCLIVAKH